MARKRLFKNAEALAEAWEKYKVFCDNKTVIRTEFSQKLGEFITATIPHPVTYDICGFCSWAGTTRQNFYATYAKKSSFDTVIACMKEDCERDARQKFENGTVPSQLAGLWMSNFGYTTKEKVDSDVDMDLNITVDYGDDQ